MMMMMMIIIIIIIIWALFKIILLVFRCSGLNVSCNSRRDTLPVVLMIQIVAYRTVLC
jgi:hypothetical protein